MILSYSMYYNFSDKQTTEGFTNEMWNALVWEPPYTRPDITTRAVESFTNIINTGNGGKNLTINSEQFDNTDHNKIYVSDMKEMAKSNSQESSSSDERSRSHSTSKESNGGANIGFKGFSLGGSGGSRKTKESSSSVFAGASNRRASDIRGMTSNTADSTTTTSEAGLTGWTVCSYVLYQTKNCSPSIC